VAAAGVNPQQVVVDRRRRPPAEQQVRLLPMAYPLDAAERVSASRYSAVLHGRAAVKNPHLRAKYARTKKPRTGTSVIKGKKEKECRIVAMIKMDCIPSGSGSPRCGGGDWHGDRGSSGCR
jgi:hypothetical protein